MLPIIRRIFVSAHLYISTAKAAFIADLTDRQMNRVVDEQLIPEPLVVRQGNSRLFTLLGAAFAKFYFSTEDLLVASARRQVLAELTTRVSREKTRDEILTLRIPESVSWKVHFQFVSVDVQPFIHAALDRAREVAQAEALVATDAEVMGGTPVFAGSRVPLNVILNSLAKGIALDRLKMSYPFLTEAYIQAAAVYTSVHPPRGRPRRLAELNPELPHRVIRTIHRTKVG
jgi:uncharacterized protein (DUF433 family)